MRRLVKFWACMLVEALWCLNPNSGSQFSLLIRSILKRSLMPVEVEFYLESTVASVVHDRLLTNEFRRELVDNVKSSTIESSDHLLRGFRHSVRFWADM